jgi:hypothetical protein
VAAANDQIGGGMKTVDEMMADVDLLIERTDLKTYWGWHSDHAKKDKTSEYRPALMQDREEFRLMLEFLVQQNAAKGSCLQLGMGVSGFSHRAWMSIFSKVLTIDLDVTALNDNYGPGNNTHSSGIWSIANHHCPYDFLFIDAGHSLEDVSLDYGHYQLLVRPGGVIAFHDWPITVFGNEIGTAVMVKR